MADVRRNGKQYGLICPKKAPLSAPKATNVFGADDDYDADDGTDWVKKALKAEGEKHKVKKQTRLDMQKALNEDPTIYQYDEVFDDMKQTEEQGKAIKKEAKQSKYIGTLLKTADRRKREQEHRIERMVQKEREAEGAMFADKESFVTSAYKAKLEELKKMEEEEQNQDRLEAIGDVTKQPDMGGFYRHFFHQTVDAAKPVEPEAPVIKKESEIDENSREIADKTNVDRDDVLPSSSGSEKSSDSEEDSRLKRCRSSRKIAAKGKRSRQYRRRVVEASESESEAEEINDDEVKAPNEESPIVDKRSNDEDSEPAKKKPKASEEDQRSSKNDKTIKQKPTDLAKEPAIEDTSSAKNEVKEITKIPDEVKEEETKIKVSIWEKRTVGPVFDAALQRYYVRKANRLSGS